MSAPTMMMAGPVAYGGIDPKMGARNMEQKKPKATTKLVIPVLPPARMPTADSAKMVRGDVPRREPMMVAMPSVARVIIWRGQWPWASMKPGTCTHARHELQSMSVHM